MAELRDAVLVALSLFRKLGVGSLSLVEFRLSEVAERGDVDQARFWRRVGRALKIMAFWASACAESRAEAALNLRSPFERAEAYSQAALDAERRAAANGNFRQDMLDIAHQWRDLAEQVRRVAEVEANPIRASG